MIELQWDEGDAPVIMWTVPKGWTWEAFHAAIDRTWEMFRERGLEGGLGLIVMMPDELSFPKGSPFISIGRGVRDIGNTNGYIVVVMRNRYHQTLINMIRRALPFGDRLYGVTSLDAARAHLAQQRAAATPAALPS